MKSASVVVTDNSKILGEDKEAKTGPDELDLNAKMKMKLEDGFVARVPTWQKKPTL